MNKKFTTTSFLESKTSGEKITVLTAYDYQMAKLLDQAGTDCILVGDSLGMVVLGYENTLEVTMEDMIHHTKAVDRATNRAFIVADMPFMSYQVSTEDAIKNAGRLVKEGKATGVKLEGGSEIIEKVKAITDAKIPVMGHIGLTPQSVNLFGGFKVQGKSEEKAKEIINDAMLLEEAGVFSIVLEGIPEKLAKLITEKLNIPTIGIGAGNDCDGQVLVVNDMLGLSEGFVPKFVKQYEKLHENISQGASEYIKEVKSGQFPKQEHTFSIDDEIIKKLY